MKKVIASWGMGILFAGGIILMGSDGGWFPWINLAGAGILGIAAFISQSSIINQQ